jgi:hypothetical protein
MKNVLVDTNPALATDPWKRAVMLSAAKHLAADGDRPFASLRVTPVASSGDYCDFWQIVNRIIIASNVQRGRRKMRDGTRWKSSKLSRYLLQHASTFILHLL